MKSKEICVKNVLIERVIELYIASFPEDERRSVVKFRNLLENSDCFHVLGFFEGEDEFVGFLSYWDFGTFRYGEHFAILPEKRNGGRGAECLQMAMDIMGKPIILEVEPPVDEMAKRRIGFYERNGCKLWPDLFYMQPAYEKYLEPIELKLMTIGDIDFDGENDEKILKIKKMVYEVDH